MESKITFPLKWLKAAAMMAPRIDIRYYLCGVLVEVFSNEARLVATDGHRMVIFRKTLEVATPARFIVPLQILDMVKPDPKIKAEPEFTYDPENLLRATLEYKGIAIQFKPIDGKFPNYTQPMNKAAKPSGELGTFNPMYLAEIARCVQIAFDLGKSYSPAIWHNGDGPAAVTYMGRDDFFAMVMPMRMCDSYSPLKWTLPQETEQQQPEEALAA